MATSPHSFGSAPSAGFERLLNLEEAAVVLRRSHWTLRGDIKSGRLRCLRIGRKIFIEARELQRILDASKQEL